MKKNILRNSGFFLIMLLMTSCSTYQYTSRQVDVIKQDIVNTRQGVDIEVDYDQVVTATSDYQISKSEALRAAEFKCLKENGIDVIVDPIVEYKISPFRLKNKCKATIIGFAGKYKEAPIGIDVTKKYTREEIENYKLLTDPNFVPFLYDKDCKIKPMVDDVYSPNVQKKNSKKQKWFRRFFKNKE